MRYLSRSIRLLSVTTLFFFIWSFLPFWQIAAWAASRDAKNDRQAQSSVNSRAMTAGERFEKVLEDMREKAAKANEREKKGEDAYTEIDVIKNKMAELDGLAEEIRTELASTEKRPKELGLSAEILNRHRTFVKNFEGNLAQLKTEVDDIDKAKTSERKAKIENIYLHLEKTRPQKKHIPLDPNKLPFSVRKAIKIREPRLKKEDFEKDFPVQKRNNLTTDNHGFTRIENEHNSAASPFAPSFVLRAGFLGQEKDLLSTANLLEWSRIKSKPVLLAFNKVASDIPFALPLPTRGEGGGEGAIRQLALSDTTPLNFEHVAAQPSVDDLAETPDIQFTDAIRAKAQELGNNPAKIYEWVRNNIEYTPTYGSIQGADMCLQSRICNDTDTASLLIALLRTSGIYAHYVYGTVEFPIEKAMNWVGGFTDPISALDLMSSGGIPVIGITTGGKITTARMEHVYVEAYVKYIPYRGAVMGTGDTWIPLDGSYKQYSYGDGMNIDTTVPTDFATLFSDVQAQSTIDSAIPSITSLPTGTIQAQLSDFSTRLNSYITTNLPQVATYYDLSKTLLGYRKIIQKGLRFLPNTLEGAKLVVRLNTFSEIPANLRHKITFALNNVNSLLGDNSLTYATYLPQIAGKRITLSYSPATSEDAQVMSNAAGILNFPLYLVQVIPELKIEGQTVATGSAIGMGQDQNFQIVFSDASDITDQVNKTLRAGEYYAIGLDANKVAYSYLYGRANNWQPDTAVNRDDRLGELLHINAMFYFAMTDHFMDEMARANNVVSLRHPSESMAGLVLSANYIFGMPSTVKAVGLNMDVQHDLLSADSKTGDSNANFWFVAQKGIYSSGMEHFSFETLMDLDSISAVRFLDLASQQAIPIYVIDSGNAQRVNELQISSNDIQDISNFINAGKTVIVPKTKIQYYDYSGVGYIALNAQTGAGAFMISGGLAGGDTVKENVKALTDLAGELIDKKVVVNSYKITIQQLLDECPNIANSPNAKFKEWTVNVLVLGDITEKLAKYNEEIGVIVGQEILYYTMIAMADMAWNGPW